MRLLLFLCLVIFHNSGFAFYRSQCKQDRFVNENFFHDKREGVFLEIGAHDGLTYSNTYFFEKNLDWTGICVEPLPERYAELVENRKCTCIQGCISDFDGISQLLMVQSPFVNVEMLSGLLHKYDSRHLERVQKEIDKYGGSYEVIDVKCFLLNNLLQENEITHVDFLSIDTEGGELDILKSIDFSKYEIDVILVEDNYRDSSFERLLTVYDYSLVRRLGNDLLFVHQRLHPEINQINGN